VTAPVPNAEFQAGMLSRLDACSESLRAATKESEALHSALAELDRHISTAFRLLRMARDKLCPRSAIIGEEEE
jgi:phage-related tail protein